MGYLVKFLEDVCHMHGMVMHIVAAVVSAVIIASSVIVVGKYIDKFEVWLMQKLSKVIGDKAAFNICNYITFPGVMVHELSHAIVALVTGASVTKVKLFELTEGDRLGYVEYVIRGSAIRQKVQLTLTSCAPVLSGFLWIYILMRVVFLHHISVIGAILLIYLAISILMHMSMSDVDIDSYKQGLLLMFPILTAGLWIYIYFFVEKVA